MHKIQKSILNLLRESSKLYLSLNGIGNKIGGEFAQTVKYHLSILEENGLVKIDRENKEISLVENVDEISGRLISLPYMGEANCGKAMTFADDHIEGYMRISSTLIPSGDIKSFFVLKARGDSMNKTNIGGRNIENGDYVIVQQIQNNMPRNGHCIVSIIDGKANIKRYVTTGSEITLLSESTENYLPIIIDDVTTESYQAIGEVVKVIKNPSNIITQ